MRRILPAIALVLAACSPAPSPSPATRISVTETSPAEQVVQAQVEAYNRRDLDAFMATYAPDLALYAHPDRPLTSGQEQARREYGTMFENVPNLHVEIANRIVQGSFVIDHEVVTGLPDGKEVRAVAIYEVREGKIQNVWFIQ